jgi:L,D-peptidoglycan transpeptidase YkuD (ErfK/YbiS/YcfS/YnhG family)
VPADSSRLAAFVLAALTLAACSTSPGTQRTSTPPGASSAGTTPVTSSPPASSLPSTTPPAPSSTALITAPSTTHSTTPGGHEQHTPAVPSRSATPSSRSGGGLPLGYRTGSATQVVTVTAPSTGSTTATLQAWSKSGSAWRRVGPPVPAFVGSSGMSTQTREGLSATPMGSFTLTQAFGANTDPGTDLPYFRTTPADWWISQTSGRGAALYNTHQRCASNCAFTQGDPNEHLRYETPYYDYAIVIDYNTANAPGGVKLGAGSAFFLHVSVGEPTAGCVSIPQDQLVRILRWLRPAAHPRILIGVS